MRPGAVLFDCDGVVVDSEHQMLAMLREDLAAHGLPLSMDEIERDYIGITVEVLAERAAAQGALLPEGWVGDFYARMYDLLRTDVALVPGILGVLEALEKAGIPFAMGSNGTEEKMQITLGQHGLVERFRGHLYSGQALGRPKPAPDLYLHAAARLGVEPGRCVVIEDSAAGARAARLAGMRCLGYAPKGAHPGLVAEGAILFDDMVKVPALLGL